MKIKNWKLKIVLLVSAFCILVNADFTRAGAVINKPPVTLGLISGLVGYWSFDGPDMSGNTAYDRSGQNNTGTLTNGPVRKAGRIGQALSFDGSNDYVGIGQLHETGPVTISAWIKIISVAAGTKTIISDTSATNRGYQIDINRTAARFSFVHAATVVLTSNTDLLANRWYHVVGTRSGTSGSWTVILYVDGVSDGSTTTTVNPTLSADPAAIGADLPTAGRYFPGLIDDVRVYNRVLTQDEIRRLYKIGATFKINVPSNTGTLKDGLVGYWSFDGPDMAGNTAYDRSGQGNNGTLTNGPVRTEGRIGQALNFDGSNDYVKTVSSPTALPLTIAVWFKSDSNTADQTLVDITADASDNVLAELRVRGNAAGDPVTAGAGNNAGFADSTSGFSAGKWHHAVGVWTSSTDRAVFLDGGNKGINTTSLEGLSGVVYIGNRRWFNHFDGLIDEVRVYNRALSSDEIKRLYKIGATFKINVPSNTGTLKDGLVGYWSFDGPDMARNTAYDRSGQNNNGTLTNGPVRTEGRIGQALEFDGVNDRVDAGSASILDDIAPMTISAWIYPRSLGEGDNGAIVAKGSGNGSWRIVTFTNNSFLFTKVAVGTDLTQRTINDSVSLNTWQHVVISWDGSLTASNVHIYKDGTELSYQTTTNGSDLVSDASFSLGIGNRAVDTTFDGLIDDVRVYNRALSADEIKRLYNMGR